MALGSTVNQRSLIALLIAFGCSRERKPATDEPQHLEPTSRPAVDSKASGASETGYAVREGQLLRVQLPGAETTPVDKDVYWCVVDNRSQVLWYTVTTDEETMSLRYMELGSQTKTVVASKMPIVREVIIDYGKEKIGGTDSVAFEVGLRIGMSSKPSIGAEIGCDGDAGATCYLDDAPLDKPVSQWPLTKELAQTRDKLNATKLDAPLKLSRLFERGRDRHVWGKYPGAAGIVRNFPKGQCDENPDDCGGAEKVPGTEFLSVVVGNARGDFFYEYRQLYDPNKKLYFDPWTKASSKTPIKDAETFDYVFISASGEHFMKDGGVVHFARGRLIETGKPCGFIGGWYFGGPRDYRGGTSILAPDPSSD